MSYSKNMNGKEFIKKANNYAKENGLDFRVTNRGKGGHKTVYMGGKITIVQTSEIPEGTLNAMCKQLGIKKKDL